MSLVGAPKAYVMNAWILIEYEVLTGLFTIFIHLSWLPPI